MRYTAWALVGLMGLLLSGCSGLILRDKDSTGDKVGKVVSRVVLCPLTLCLSEAAIVGIKTEEELTAWRDRLDRTPIDPATAASMLSMPLYPPMPIAPFPAYQSPRTGMPMHQYNFSNGHSVTCIEGQFATNCF